MKQICLSVSLCLTIATVTAITPDTTYCEMVWDYSENQKKVTRMALLNYDILEAYLNEGKVRTHKPTEAFRMLMIHRIVKVRRFAGSLP